MIDLNKVPKKYEGLNGTELAISESQERMAVVVRKEDAEKFQELASMENLETTIVAEVTEEPRMIMTLQGEEIVNISREVQVDIHLLWLVKTNQKKRFK